MNKRNIVEAHHLMNQYVLCFSSGMINKKWFTVGTKHRLLLWYFFNGLLWRLTTHRAFGCWSGHCDLVHDFWEVGHNIRPFWWMRLTIPLLAIFCTKTIRFMRQLSSINKSCISKYMRRSTVWCASLYSRERSDLKCYRLTDGSQRKTAY